jgi:hypothetical protein
MSIIRYILCRYGRLALLLFVGNCLYASVVQAQRLVIGLKTPGSDYPKVIYGRLHEGKLYIYEEFWSAGKSASTQVTSDSVQTRLARELAAKFSFLESEHDVCVRSERYKALLALLKVLSRPVVGVDITSSEEWSACVSDIEASLAPMPITSRSPSEAGLQLSFHWGSAKNSLVPGSAAVATSNFKLDLTMVRINEEPVIVGEDGFFIFILQTMDPAMVSLQLPDGQRIRREVRPVILTSKPIKVGGSTFYTERIASFGAQTETIALRPIPQLQGDHLVDLGLGGGLGYGREIPGEVRGGRFYTQLGYEQLLDGALSRFGIKAWSSFSSANQSVVPYTLTGRLSAFYAGAAFGARLAWRFGLGGELFMTKLKQGATDGSGRAYIPEQVVAPLTWVSGELRITDWLYANANLAITPLYVAGSGFYPSLNPHFELAYKVNARWVIAAGTGSETHQYPSVLGDTKLQVDYSMISIRRAIL